jgi:uncharacterized membrane protein
MSSSSSEPGAGDALRHSWVLAKRDFGGTVVPLAVAIVLIAVINIGINLGAVPLLVGASMAGGGRTAGGVVAALAAVPAVVVMAFFSGGIYLFCSELVRGLKPAFGRVFSGGPVFISALLAIFGSVGIPQVLLPILQTMPFVGTVGTLLVFVGGLVAPWAVAAAVDRRLQGPDAAIAGWREAFRAPGTSILFMLAGGAGILACCVGVLVTMPLMYIAVAYVYHARKGAAAALAG